MPRQPPAGIPFALSSYRSGHLPISAQQLVNWYCQVQRQGMDAKSPAPLIQPPGLVEFCTPGAGPIRAAIEMAGTLYVVSGQEFFSISSTGVETYLGGGITPGLDVIGIATSGTEIIVVDGVKGFSYKPADGTPWAQISDVDFLPARTVTYLNGYFIFESADTNQFFSSDANNGRSYDALFFSSAETNPDDIELCLSHHQQLYILGSNGFEIWQFNPNTSAFPWVRYPGASGEIGTAGPRAATTHKNNIYMVGSDWLFYRVDGVVPTPLSDPGVAAAWKGYGDISDVVVWGITWGVQEWIFITFPSAQKTWVFDATTGFFHERESHESDMNPLYRWRGAVTARAYGRQFIGDAFSNQVGYLDDATYTEYGNPIRSRAVAPAMHRKGEIVFMSSLELLMRAGVGTTSGQGSDPQVMLDWSEDDGYTWEPYEMWASMGALGNRQTPILFTELGSFVTRTYRLTITDPVPRVLLCAIPKAQGGLEYG